MGSNETSFYEMISEIKDKKRKLTEAKVECQRTLDELTENEAILATKQFSRAAKEIKTYLAYSVEIKCVQHLFATRAAAVRFAKEKLGEELGSCATIETEEVKDCDLIEWTKDNTLHYE